MKQRWIKFCKQAGVKLIHANLAEQIYEQNIAIEYLEKHRRYHTLNHIAHCLDELEIISLSVSGIELAAITLAIWFHDIAYLWKSNNKSDELVSADICLFHSKSIGLEALGHDAATMIKMSNHEWQEPEAISENEKCFLDIDLSILGQDKYDYAIYEAQIRAEYKHVSDDLFYSKRKEILKSFLDRPSIYYTKYFHEKYEVQARINLQWSIDMCDRVILSQEIWKK